MPPNQIARTTIDACVPTGAAFDVAGACHSEPAMRRIAIAVDQMVNRSNESLHRRGMVDDPTSRANAEDVAAILREIDRLETFAEVGRRMLDAFATSLDPSSPAIPPSAPMAARHAGATGVYNAAGAVVNGDRWINHAPQHSAEANPRPMPHGPRPKPKGPATLAYEAAVARAEATKPEPSISEGSGEWKALPAIEPETVGLLDPVLTGPEDCIRTDEEDVTGTSPDRSTIETPPPEVPMEPRRPGRRR